MNLKVTAHLLSPLAGHDPPHLDSLLEYEMSQRLGLAHKVDRRLPAPPVGSVRIPMLRRSFGGHAVACCSSPILDVANDGVEHFTKRLGVEHSGLLALENRRKIATGNSTFKSYRLPLRRRLVSRIVWFCVGERRSILKLLKSVHSLSKKRSVGYGAVERWEVDRADADFSWFAASESGPVLMRPLPVCDELPAGLIGAKRDFGAFQPPYWHPERYAEIVVPC